MNRQDVPVYFIMAWYAFLLAFALFFAIVLTIPPADARPIQTPEYWTEYQDYLGNTYRYTNINLSQHPEYLKTENSTHYILNRIDDILLIKKSLVYNGYFNFGTSDISFTIIAPASKIQNISTANGTGQRRFPIDESLKTTYKRFQWDNKLPFVQIINNTGYNYTVPQSDYWYSRQSGQLYFNFKTANVTGLSEDKNASFKFSSWIIDNATTSGYTSSNVSTDGYWSAYGGGSIGTPLNQSIHTNLSLYVDCEATTGNIGYAINRYSRFPNTTIQGTWHGNATLNYTAGQSWGNACSFDGVNDYYNFGNKITLNKNYTILYKLKSSSAKSPLDFANSFLVDTNGLNYFMYQISLSGWRVLIGIIPDNTWQILTFNYITDTLNFYINNVIDDTSTQPQLNTTGEYFYIGGINGYLNGLIDELIITLSENMMYSNSTYATSYNFTSWNQTASAGKIISAVRFNVPYLNILNNTANIYACQNNTGICTTLISSNYQNNTWVNFTGYPNTDIRFEGLGNGSARQFVVSGEVDEAIPLGTTYTLSGYVNNTDGADIIGATVKANSITSISDIGGYYSISGLNGIYPLTIHAMGYNNYSGLVSISGNTTMNITLSEKDTTTTDEAISYSIVFAMLFFAIVIKRRKKQ